MVTIIVPVNTNLPSDAVVTGYIISKDYPKMIHPCQPTTVSRVYRGFGQMRVETGKPPRRGFGTVIGEKLIDGGCRIGDVEMNQGKKLWVRVED